MMMRTQQQPSSRRASSSSSSRMLLRKALPIVALLLLVSVLITIRHTTSLMMSTMTRRDLLALSSSSADEHRRMMATRTNLHARTNQMFVHSYNAMPTSAALNNWGRLRRDGNPPQPPRADELAAFFNDTVSAAEDARFVSLMQEVQAAAHRCGTTAMLAAGTLAGALVMHRRLPWDDDADMYVVGNEDEDVCVKNDVEMREGRTGMTAITTGGQYFKVFYKDSPKAGKLPWGYPFVDVFTLRSNATHMWQKTKADRPDPQNVYQRDWILPTVKKVFHGQLFDAPGRSILYARRKYGDQFFSCARGGWNHRREVGQERATVDCDRLRPLYAFVRRERTVSPEVVLEHLVQGDKVLHTSVMLNRSAVALVARTNQSAAMPTSVELPRRIHAEENAQPFDSRAYASNATNPPQPPRADELAAFFNDTVSAAEDARFVSLMQEVQAAAHRCGTTAMLAAGTLAGALVMHRRLPWDDDADMYVVGNEDEDVCVKNDVEMREGRTGMTAITTGGQYFKVFYKDSPKAGKLPWGYPFVDVFTLRSNATHMWQKIAPSRSPWRRLLATSTDPASRRPPPGYFHPARLTAAAGRPDPQNVYQRDWILPTVKKVFHGQLFDAPGRSILYARRKYGDQFFSCARGGWNHRREVGQERATVDCDRLRPLYAFVRRERTVSPEVVLEHLVQGDKVLHTSVMLNRSAVALLVAQTSRSSSSESLSITLLLMMCVGSVVMPATS
ncbi:hypothetical protein RI054_23g99040 [Pseudoscourfieldia marina]